MITQLAELSQFFAFQQYEPDLHTPLANSIEILAPSERSQYDNNILNDHDHNLNNQHHSRKIRLLTPTKEKNDYGSVLGGGGGGVGGGADENLVSQLKHIQRQLVQLNEYIRSKEENEMMQLEWEWLAALLDRCLLIVFTFIALSVTCIICFMGIFVQQDV